MNPLCPLCKLELKVEDSEIYPNYPSYRCTAPYEECFRKTHYIKYFEADWTYSRYREEAYLQPYRILNFYDYRKPETTGFIQEEKYVRQGLMMNSRLKYVTLLRVTNSVVIPQQNHFVDKIKTLLVFS